jgi:hypothetical protein
MGKPLKQCVQEIPPMVWVDLEEFPGRAYHENAGPIAAAYDGKGHVIFSGPVIYEAPKESFLPWKSGR